MSEKKDNLKIIAEVGVNHNGSINIAKKLVDFPFYVWLERVFLPVGVLLFLGSGVGASLVCCFDPSLKRMLATLFSVSLTVTIGAWPCLLDYEEKKWIKSKIGLIRRKYFLSGS